MKKLPPIFRKSAVVIWLIFAAGMIGMLFSLVVLDSPRVAILFMKATTVLSLGSAVLWSVCWLVHLAKERDRER